MSMQNKTDKEKIIMDTNYGQIIIELDSNSAPQTVQNFLNYVKADFYSNTIFHRVIDGFMIQGGGFDRNFQQKEILFSSVQNEANNAGPNKRGTVAMARTSDPHSATAQFFINVVDNEFLNFSGESSHGWGYCVFGKVIEGMDVVDKIKIVSTTSRAGHQNVPIEPVVITKVNLV